MNFQFFNKELIMYTTKDIATLICGRVVGDDKCLIKGFAKIEDAKEGDITFIANPKYSHYIYTTKASAVLVSESFDYEGEINTTLIRVKDPYVALADLLNMAQASKPKPTGIESPSFISDSVTLPQDCYIGAFAYIGKNVTLGEGVRIYPQVFIGDNVKIGDNTELRSGVKIYNDCKIGNNCIIHAGTVIGSDGFGFAPLDDGSYEKIPQIGNVEIEDDVEIGANATIDRATFGSTRIGRGTKLDNLVQVAHNVEIGNGNVFAAQTGIAGSTKIGNYNQVGGQCGFAGHIKIGDFNQIGAQSGIPNSIGDHKRIIGYPAIDAHQFARNQVYLKRLGDLFKNNKL